MLGCGRSGTTWVQRLLASHPKVKTGIESNLFPAYLGPPIRRWMREMSGLQEAGAGAKGASGMVSYLRDDQFRTAYNQFVDGLTQPMVASLGPGDLFVEKTPDHVLWIPEIISTFPNCRIVHVVRDCRDVVCSILARSREGGNWPKTARAAARFWVVHVEAGFRGGEKYRDQYFEVRYERLKATPAETLRRLGDFLGLSWDDDTLNSAVRKNDASTSDSTGTEIPVLGELATGKYENRVGVIRKEYGKVRKAAPGSWKDELSLKQKFEVWGVARKTMAKAGYPWKHPW